jgi:hypothetical protein
MSKKKTKKAPTRTLDIGCGLNFLSFTPAFPHGPAFRDPTHVNIITEDTFPMYFDHEKRLAKSYGFNGGFQILKQEWKGVHLLTLMKKVPEELLGEGLMPSNQVKIG